MKIEAEKLRLALIGVFVGFMLGLLACSMAIAGDHILSWKDNSTSASNQESGFYLMQRYGPTTSGWTVRTVIGPDTTTWNVNIPNDSTQWCFQIVAFNQAGEAKPSNTVCLRDQ